HTRAGKPILSSVVGSLSSPQMSHRRPPTNRSVGVPTVSHTLSVGGLRRGDDFAEGQPNPQDSTAKADVGTDGLAVRVVQFDRHPPTAHHPRRLAHVRRKAGVIVDKREDVIGWNGISTEPSRWRVAKVPSL